MGALFGAIANVFGYVLKFWFDICGNYGWAVVLFSITIKAIVFPLTLKQQKSLKKNQELQPKLAELQEKYKDNQQQMSVEYQKFMKENKYNPFGGCILMIVQLFVLLGVFYVVANPIKYMEHESDENIHTMLQQAIVNIDFSGDVEEFNKFAKTTVESYSGDDKVKEIIEQNKLSGDGEIYTVAIFERQNRYYELKILKDKYKENLTIFGIDLSHITAENPSDLKLWVFPILTTVFYYISLWMVSRKQKKNTKPMKDANGNEIQMPNMMAMNIMMPLMSGWISYSVPQGMGLYWFMNSLLQIIIQAVTDLIIDKGKNKDDSSKTEVVLKPIDPIKDESDKYDENNESETDSDPINNKSGKNPNSSKKKKKKNKK